MKRKIPYYQCLTIIILMSLTLIINVLFLNKPIYLGLFIGVIISIAISFINGFTIKEIFRLMYKGLSENFKIILIYTMIGILIGIWKIGGITPSILYYSFGVINKNIFLFSSFAISTVIGLIMGTSSGTVSTAGIVLIGLGTSIGFKPGIVAGAVMSGAFFGDRSSPISGMLNVVSSSTGTKTYENFKHLWSTMTIGIISASIFYLIIGLQVKGYNYDVDSTQQYKQVITEIFNVSPWLMLPPIMLIIFSFFRIPVVYTLLSTIFLSGVFSIYHQSISFFELLKVSFFGYNPIVSEQYNVVLAGGGIISLKSMLIVLVLATSLNGLFEGAEIITTMVNPFIEKIKNHKDLQIFTLIFSIGTTALLCNQLMSVIIPSAVLKNKFKEMEVDKKTLPLILSDSGVMACSLIPWNVAALTPSILMGVPVLDFAPYTFLGYAMPIIAIIKILLDRGNNKKIGGRGIYAKEYNCLQKL